MPVSKMGSKRKMQVPSGEQGGGGAGYQILKNCGQHVGRKHAVARGRG